MANLVCSSCYWCFYSNMRSMGLARIPNRPSLNRVNLGDYNYVNMCGAGVTAYVVDSDTHVGHKQFEGRAKWGITISPDGKKC